MNIKNRALEIIGKQALVSREETYTEDKRSNLGVNS